MKVNIVQTNVFAIFGITVSTHAEYTGLRVKRKLNSMFMFVCVFFREQFGNLTADKIALLLKIESQVSLS